MCWIHALAKSEASAESKSTTSCERLRVGDTREILSLSRHRVFVVGIDIPAEMLREQ